MSEAALPSRLAIPPPTKKQAFREVFALYLITLVVVRMLVDLVRIAGLPEVLQLGVPLLFMYVPVWMCEQWRKVDSWSYPLATPGLLDWRAWSKEAPAPALVALVITVPFVIGYHYWQTMGVPWVEGLLDVRLFSETPAFRWVVPEALLLQALYQLFFVAIPEEIFYRGYMQTRLDEAYGTPWEVLGAKVGPGLLITTVLFAFGHSLVTLQWWHGFIIFPSLVFGWLRARTGGVVAGAFFHAYCNFGVHVLDTLYGLRG